jgi:hypothetical protein
LSSAIDLQAQAVELLGAAADALDTLPLLGLEGSPVRRFVSPGEPALDCCEQLTVHVQQITEAPTLPGGMAVAHRPGWLNLCHFVVTIARCVPQKQDFEPQDALVLDDAAAQGNADAWALWNHLHDMHLAGTLFTLCGAVFWDGMRALVPSGGCAGWVLLVRAELNGYDDVTS